ncbi:MAG: GldG family protein, partial [Spirochaetaceae bacterium]|nr:GldG family protein [Spirochaetaceae bacterium]
MNKRETFILSALSLLAIVLAFLVTRRISFRIDMSDNRAYTISKVSRDLYQELEDRVRISYFLSDRLARIHPVPRAIEDLLREYADNSRGKIEVSVKDPVKAGLTSLMERLGLVANQIEIVEQDQASVATVYSGILIEYLDRQEVLPFVFSVDTLEYDLTSRIRNMARDKQREVGVIVGDADKSWLGDYGYLDQAFRGAAYRVREISAGEAIPDELPMLLVIGGAGDMDEMSLYRIDRYIQGGGRVFFAVESVAINFEQGIQPEPILDKGLLAMVSFYGATVKPELVLDQNALTWPLRTQTAGGMIQHRLIKYPFWLGIRPEAGNKTHPVTSAFNGVDLYWASPLELTPPEGISAEALFSSTDQAWLMTKNFAASPEAADYLFRQEEPDTKGPRIMAAALAGTFPSWFEGVSVDGAAFQGEEFPAMTASPSRIVVLGDTDYLTGIIAMTLSERNLSFMVQAADWLGNDDDIISISSRSSPEGRLDKITDPVKRRG